MLRAPIVPRRRSCSTPAKARWSICRAASSVWTSNPKVADVYVNSPRQINLFGKEAGEATIIATAADGSVVYGANVRVNQNISNINEILHQAMPESNIDVRTVGQVAVINGTVASPEDAAQAEMLVKAASTRASTSTRKARH